MPAWVSFNWGSRGTHFKVGGAIVGDVLWPRTMQVNLYGHDERNGELLNVFHVVAPEDITGDDCDNVAAAVCDWVDGGYNNLWAENISSDRIVVTDVSVVDSFQSELACNHSGTRIGAALPSQNTLAVKKSTGLQGRQHRGTWYVWPATSSDLELLDSNLFQSSYISTVVSEMGALITVLNAAGYTLVVASEAGGVTTEVKSFVVVDRLVDSQNRRGGDRGR